MTAGVAGDGQPVPERPEDVTEVLTDILRELSTLVVGEEDLDAALRRTIELAIRTIPGCDAAGVTLFHEGQPFTAAWSDDRTLGIDRDQYDVGDGPCLDSIRRGVVNRVDVDSAARQWPEFAAAAKAQGVTGFLAAPLIVRDRPVGGLNLYSHDVGGFDAHDETLVMLLTGPVGTALTNARRFAEVRSLADQLEGALTSRAVIEQAKGVLVSRQAVDADTAFALLRRESQRRNVKLRDVATELVSQAEEASHGQTGG